MAIDIARVAVVLLAGGRATRFGADKLAQPLGGVPLAFHAGRTLADMAFARHVVVTGPTLLDFTALGFERVQVAPGTVMSGSIGAGVAAIDRTDCDACVIALADMPFVPADHFAALLAAHTGGVTATATATATTARSRRMVPAVFGRGAFARLRSLEGDRGASAMLHEGHAVVADENWLADVDTPDDLARLRR